MLAVNNFKISNTPYTDNGDSKRRPGEHDLARNDDGIAGTKQ